MLTKPFLIASLACTALCSGCIFTKDLSRLWTVANVDETLHGEWEDTSAALTFKLQFVVDAANTNMSCILTLGNPGPQSLPPTRCRTIKDAESNISFLLFPDATSTLASFLNNGKSEGSGAMGLLVPYRVVEDRTLHIFFHNERMMAQLIEDRKLHGGLLLEEGNPPSRTKLRPFLESPSCETLRLVAVQLVDTNAPLMKLVSVNTLNQDKSRTAPAVPLPWLHQHHRHHYERNIECTFYATHSCWPHR
jgi:hypothetical protein